MLTGKSALLNGCLLLADRPPVLLLSGGEIDRVRRTMPWIEEVHAIPILEAPRLVAGAVEETIAPVLTAPMPACGA